MAFTVYAGLTQVPADLLEAASIDGAGAWQRFRYIMLPTLKPILMILIALSTLWDFRVFTQIYVLQRPAASPVTPTSRRVHVPGVDRAERLRPGRGDRDRDDAAHVVLTLGYLRSMFKQEADLMKPRRDRRSSRTGLANVGRDRRVDRPVPGVLDGADVVPSRVDMQSPDPSFLPFPGTLNNYRKVFEPGLLLDGDPQQPDRHGDHRRLALVDRLPRRGRDLAVQVPRPRWRCSLPCWSCRWCPPRR